MIYQLGTDWEVPASGKVEQRVAALRLQEIFNDARASLRAVGFRDFSFSVAGEPWREDGDPESDWVFPVQVTATAPVTLLGVIRLLDEGMNGEELYAWFVPDKTVYHSAFRDWLEGESLYLVNGRVPPETGEAVLSA